jgi:hypothetical protein
MWRGRTSGIGGAASGHANAAPPTSLMNSRFIGSPRGSPGGPESRWARSAPPTERIAHLCKAGDCYAAGFRFGLGRLRVNRVVPPMERYVCFTPDCVL